MYVVNLQETVTESYFGELFGLRTANYLQDNYPIEIWQSQGNGRRNGHAVILTPNALVLIFHLMSVVWCTFFL